MMLLTQDLVDRFEAWFQTIQKMHAEGKHHPNQPQYDQTLKANYLWPFMNLPPVQQGCVLYDIGCAYGSMSLGAHLLGYEVKAFDINLDYASEAFSGLGIPVWWWDLNNQCPVEKKADVVVFTEVLEHLDFNPLRAMGHIHEAMVPGGRLIMSTPRAEMSVHHTPDLADMKRHWSCLPGKRDAGVKPEDRHHHLYTNSQLFELLEKSGFRILTYSNDLWGGLHVGVVAQCL